MYPLVRISKVFGGILGPGTTSGLTTVETAYPASQPVSHVAVGSFSSVSNGSNREPWGASGVICWPILGRDWTLGGVGWTGGADCARASAPEKTNASYYTTSRLLLSSKT